MARKKYQAVFVLAAGVEKKEDGSGWFFPDIDKKGRAMLGEFRLKAAAKLFRDKAVSHLVMVGGLQEGIQKVDIMEERLKNYEVNRKNIDKKVSELNTEGNAVAINEYFAENPNFHRDRCAFLTNFYHIPRTLRIFADNYNLRLRPIIAESLLFNKEAERKKILEIYTSPAMSARLGSELNGLMRWEHGTYGKKN